MKNGIRKFSFLFLLLFSAHILSAQSSSGGDSNFLIYSLFAVVAIILLFVITQVADNLIQIEAKEMGAEDGNFSIFPSSGDLFAPKLPAYTKNGSVKVLKKGHDILLEGGASEVIDAATSVTRFAVQPKNFIGMSPIPKLTVEVGDEVAAGDVVFFDKKRPEIKYVTPVSGEVVEINRGEKRSIAEIVVLADKEQKHKEFAAFDLDNSSREDLVNYLLESGAWALIKQRPFDIVPGPQDLPRDIFISTFDSAPLAPNSNLVVEGRAADFQKGLDVLNKLTEGSVHLGLNANGEEAPSSVFTEAANVTKTWFSGKHPAGNVGVQIHHTKAINAGDKVWVLNPQDVLAIGSLFLNRKVDGSRIVALTGQCLSNPRYVKTYAGANIGELLSGEISDTHSRIISGDVLTGKTKTDKEYLNAGDDQISVIEEGDYYEMFGWLLPIAPRPSISGTFPNFLYKDHKFEANTNMHGERRAFVVTGQYESVLPMDIYPQHLMKAIIVNDFERMEGLGIYELSEEDIALCEFACTSKQPLQSILREGLDTMREQV